MGKGSTRKKNEKEKLSDQNRESGQKAAGFAGKKSPEGHQWDIFVCLFAFQSVEVFL